jgi:hypothetical protein
VIGNIGVDNIIAALLLSLAMMRRLEVLGIEPGDNPQVSRVQFDDWRQQALRGYNTVALASLLKVALSLAWLAAFANVSGVLQVGGIVIFIAWIVAIVWSWRLTTEARAVRAKLGIARRPS